MRTIALFAIVLVTLFLFCIATAEDVAENAAETEAPQKEKTEEKKEEARKKGKSRKKKSWAETATVPMDPDDPFYHPMDPENEPSVEQMMGKKLSEPALGIVNLVDDETRTSLDAERIARRWGASLLNIHQEVSISAIDKDTVVVYTSVGTNKYEVIRFLKQMEEVKEVDMK